jgi:hypothetical protein
MLLTAEGKKVLFSGDLSGKLAAKDVPAALQEEALELFVCEMAHFGWDDLAPYLENCHAKRVWFNHVYPLVKYERIAAEAASGAHAFSIGAPADGAELVL